MAPISVTAANLKEVFEKRLKPPDVLPSQFDAIQHKMNEVLAGLIPDSTEDTTEEAFFSVKWNDDDMVRLKDHILKHSLDSMEGVDQTSYAQLLEIPNDDLAYLCNECVQRWGRPIIWFISTLIGILKCLKPHDNPDSYRLIALQSCFLEGLIILIHCRIRVQTGLSYQ
jgi:hypothetical protein